MKKRFFIALFLLIIFSTYNFTLNPNFIPNLNIKKIIVKNNEIINDDEIRKKLSFLYETNILFLKYTKLVPKNKLFNPGSNELFKLINHLSLKFLFSIEYKEP